MTVSGRWLEGVWAPLMAARAQHAGARASTRGTHGPAATRRREEEQEAASSPRPPFPLLCPRPTSALSLQMAAQDRPQRAAGSYQPGQGLLDCCTSEQRCTGCQPTHCLGPALGWGNNPSRPPGHSPATPWEWTKTPAHLPGAHGCSLGTGLRGNRGHMHTCAPYLRTPQTKALGASTPPEPMWQLTLANATAEHARVPRKAERLEPQPASWRSHGASVGGRADAPGRHVLGLQTQRGPKGTTGALCEPGCPGLSKSTLTVPILQTSKPRHREVK